MAMQYSKSGYKVRCPKCGKTNCDHDARHRAEMEEADRLGEQISGEQSGYLHPNIDDVTTALWLYNNYLKINKETGKIELGRYDYSEIRINGRVIFRPREENDEYYNDPWFKRVIAALETLLDTMTREFGNIWTKFPESKKLGPEAQRAYAEYQRVFSLKSEARE